MDSVDHLLQEWRLARPDLNPSAVAVVGRISRLSTLQTRRAERWLEPLGLTWESFSLIVTLRRAGEPYQLRPLELLHDSLLTSGAMTNRIDRVEALGLVARLRDPYDRRGVIVQLTNKGLVLADQAIALHLAQLDRLLEALASEEQNRLAGLLSKLLTQLERAEEPTTCALSIGTTAHTPPTAKTPRRRSTPVEDPEARSHRRRTKP